MESGLKRKGEETIKVTELITEDQTVPVKGGFVYMGYYKQFRLIARRGTYRFIK